MNPYTELITGYINGELSAAEKAAFETQLTTNTELKTEYDLQLKVVEGIKRLGLKNQLASSFSAVKTKKMIAKAVIGTLLILAALGVFLLIRYHGTKSPGQVMYELNEAGNPNFSPSDTTVSQVNYPLNEAGHPNWSQADKNLASQIFRLNAKRDTIIETRQGIVLAIPAGAFKTTKGATASGVVDLEIKEALTAADIMKAGLSTMSNDLLLETGGMFYINAHEGKNNLSIDLEKPLNVNVPVNNAKPDMMLFKGERQANGNINWVDPKPMKRRLSTLDMANLDLYPGGFLDTLKKMGFNVKNKKLTDSIYYSYSGYCAIRETSGDTPTSIIRSESDAVTTTVPVVRDPISPVSSSSRIISRHAKSDTVATSPPAINKGNCEIDPSRVRAIWNNTFNHTILATKAFEERLKVIFKTCDSRVFNLYVNNLDKNLYEADSMAAWLLSGGLKTAFLDFYARKDGGVDISDAQNKELQNYFEKKHSAYTQAITETLQKLYDSENAQNQAAAKQILQHQNDETIRSSATFAQEFKLNLNEAYKQLGMPTFPASIRTSTNTYASLTSGNYLSAPLIVTGWCNVDRYALDATRNRTSLNFKDNFSGKKANIAYKPVSVTVADYTSYDRVVCYMIPDKLSSFQTMNYSGDRFKQTFNELLAYSIVTIGFKGEKRFYSEVKQAQPQAYQLNLKAIEPAALDLFLNKSFPLNQAVDLSKDLNYQLFDMKESKRQYAIAQRESLRYRILPVVLPCANPVFKSELQ